MKNPRFVFLVVISVLVFGVARQGAAADVAGRTVFRGQEIILYSDGTWVFDEKSDAARKAGTSCFRSQIIEGVRLCYDTRKFQRTDLGQDWEFAATNRQGTIYFGWIVEGIVIPVETMGSIVIDTAAEAAIDGHESISIRRDEPAEISGKSLRVLEYFGEVQGIQATYLNYHGPIDDKGTIQLVFIVPGDSLDPFSEDIAELLGSFQIE